MKPAAVYDVNFIWTSKRQPKLCFSRIIEGKREVDCNGLVPRNQILIVGAELMRWDKFYIMLALVRVAEVELQRRMTDVELLAQEGLDLAFDLL